MAAAAVVKLPHNARQLPACTGDVFACLSLVSCLHPPAGWLLPGLARRVGCCQLMLVLSNAFWKAPCGRCLFFCCPCCVGDEAATQVGCVGNMLEAAGGPLRCAKQPSSAGTRRRAPCQRHCCQAVGMGHPFHPWSMLPRVGPRVCYKLCTHRNASVGPGAQMTATFSHTGRQQATATLQRMLQPPAAAASFLRKTLPWVCVDEGARVVSTPVCWHVV